MQKPIDVVSVVRAALVRALEPGIDAEAIGLNWELYAPPLRMDSLGFHRVIVDLERTFGGRFDDDLLASSLVETVADLCALTHSALDAPTHDNA